MQTIEDLFNLRNAQATSFSKYKGGDVAYVTNGFNDNGVLGFVTPFPDDTVHTVPAIVLSAFCEATVQVPPFIARGNGGSGLVVLEPKHTMPYGMLVALAATINTHLRWRFSWSRLVTIDRIKNLTISVPNTSGKFEVAKLLPKRSRPRKLEVLPPMNRIELSEIFHLVAGNFHNASELPKGKTPLISCGDSNNGINGFVSVGEKYLYSHRLTIAFNGMNTLTAKYHPYRFAAKDDVAICEPKRPLSVGSLLFIQLMIRREMWRYSYYRKCFMDKLKRQEISLPMVSGWVDEAEVQRILQSSPYWEHLETRLTSC